MLTANINKRKKKTRQRKWVKRKRKIERNFTLLKKVKTKQHSREKRKNLLKAYFKIFSQSFWNVSFASTSSTSSLREVVLKCGFKLWWKSSRCKVGPRSWCCCPPSESANHYWRSMANLWSRESIFKSGECVSHRSCPSGMPAKAENVASARSIVNQPLSWSVKRGTSGWGTFQRTSEKIE